MLFIIPVLISAYLWYRGANDTPVTHFPITKLVEYDAFPWLPIAEPLQFPRDHGAHDNVPVETWQLQGFLSLPEQRKIAFQLNIFALTLQPQTPKRLSGWATKRIFLTYFTVTDPGIPGFLVEHREAREALGLSNAGAGHIQMDDWKLGIGANRIQLLAGERGRYLQLELTPESRGLTANVESSILHSYRLPRLTARGRYGERAVIGTAWMEHAWGRLPLPGGAVSLQRLQLRMNEGGLLSCLQLKRRNVKSSGPVRCMVSTAAGKQTSLEGAQLIAVSHWRSPEGKVYPVSWRLESRKLKLKIEAVTPNQIIPGPFSWWSGWVRAKGEEGKRGEGFMQATEVER